MEDETQNTSPSPELPPSPSFTEAIDRIFREEDPKLISCLVSDVNGWWQAMGLSGRTSATPDDLIRLFQRFHLTTQCLPNARPIPFAPRGARLTAEQSERLVAELEDITKPPNFLRGPNRRPGV